MRGIDYYFQFKMSKHIRTRNGLFWNFYHDNYYHFKLNPNDNYKQHNDLSDIAIYHNKWVYYVAPIFNDTQQFQNFYYKSEIIDNSALIPLSGCRRYYGSQLGQTHKISYDKFGRKFTQHSEPIHGLCSNGKDFMHMVNESLETQNNVVALTDEYYWGMLSYIIGLDVESIGNNQNARWIAAHKKFIDEIGIMNFYSMYLLANFNIVLAIAAPNFTG